MKLKFDETFYLGIGSDCWCFSLEKTTRLTISSSFGWRILRLNKSKVKEWYLFDSRGMLFSWRGLFLLLECRLCTRNLTNLIYRLFRKTSMNGVRLGFYIRIECLYIRPRRVLENIWGFICPIEGTKNEFSVPSTACHCVKHLVQRWKQKIWIQLNGRAFRGERPHSKTARKKNYFTINCCCRIIRKNLQFFIPFYLPWNLFGFDWRPWRLHTIAEHTNASPFWSPF